MPDHNTVPDSARIQELWLAIKTLLAEKVNIKTLDNYTTVDAVATAIATSLTDYARLSDVDSNITNALQEYFTKSEVNSKIVEAIRSITTLKIEVVDSLPKQGTENIIYLVSNPDGKDDNVKLEYLWIDDVYELIGSTSVDLSGYWSKEELKIMSNEELEAIINSTD